MMNLLEIMTNQKEIRQNGIYEIIRFMKFTEKRKNEELLNEIHRELL